MHADLWLNCQHVLRAGWEGGMLVFLLFLYCHSLFSFIFLCFSFISPSFSIPSLRLFLWEMTQNDPQRVHVLLDKISVCFLHLSENVSDVPKYICFFILYGN